MADIFISYKSQRRKAVEHLAGIFRMNGYSVWYDAGLNTGQDFSAQIEKELHEAKAVLTLWCKLSITSEWVKEEAHLAKQLGTAVPILIEPVTLPFGFGLSDTVDLTKWDGSPRSPLIDRVLMQVGIKVGRDPAPNLRDLIAFEEPWRRYGAPSLAQFALDQAALSSEEHHKTGLKRLGEKLSNSRVAQLASGQSFAEALPHHTKSSGDMIRIFAVLALLAGGIGGFVLFQSSKRPEAGASAPGAKEVFIPPASMAIAPVIALPVAVAPVPVAIASASLPPSEPAAAPQPVAVRKLSVVVVADDWPAESVLRSHPIVRKIDRELNQMVESNGLRVIADPRATADQARQERTEFSVESIKTQLSAKLSSGAAQEADVFLSFRTYVELQRIPVAPNLTRPALRVVARLHWVKSGQSFATVEPRSGSIAPVLTSCDSTCLLDALSTDLRVITTDIARFAAERTSTDSGRPTAQN